MNTILIIIVILTAIFAGFYLIARARLKNIPVVADHKNILTLTDRNFQQQTKNKLILVDFWASWCAPCRIMAPVLNDVAAELNGNKYVGKVNIEQYQALAQRFRIKSIPTMILIKNGKEYERFVGIKSKEFLLNKIHKAI